MFSIRFWIYDRRLKEINLSVTEKNKMCVQFKINDEIDKVRDKLKRLQEKGIIEFIKKNPETKNKDYRQKVKDMVMARHSMIKALKILNQKV